MDAMPRWFTKGRWMRTCGTAIAVALTALGFGGCESLTSATSGCGDKTSDGRTIEAPFAFPLPEGAFRDGGAAYFTWSHEFSGLCSTAPDADTSAVVYAYVREGVPLPQGFGGEARVYHAAGFQPYKSPLVFEQVAWAGRVLNIGLHQGNPGGGPATVIVELSVSFNSSGNIDDDRVTASRLISKVYLSLNYFEPRR